MLSSCRFPSLGGVVEMRPDLDPRGLRARTSKQDCFPPQAVREMNCARKSCEMGTIQTLVTELNSSLPRVALSTCSCPTTQSTADPPGERWRAWVPSLLSMPHGHCGGRFSFWTSPCLPSPHTHFCLGPTVSGVPECSSLQTASLPPPVLP